MKILVINHSRNTIYGAAKSLQLYLNNVDYKYDIIFPKSLVVGKEDDRLNEAYFKSNDISYLWLPFQTTFVGNGDITLLGSIYITVVNILARLSKKTTKRKFSEYDIVYLNSLVLNNLISDEVDCIIHVREIFEGTSKQFNKTLANLNKCKEVIFIDKSTYLPFAGQITTKFLILNNPIDMSGLNSIDSDEVYKELDIDASATVFSMLGNINENKGSDFVVENFPERDDIVLLIVGNLKSPLAKRLLQRSQSNIKYIAELENPDKIYKVTDVLIRGEDKFCIGRTCLEALYSNCMVLLPGAKKDIVPDDTELYKNKENITFYQPRDVDTFHDAIVSLTGYRKENKDNKSNISTYVEKMNAVILRRDRNEKY